MKQLRPEERLVIYQILVRQFANAASPCIPGANWSVNGSGTFDGITDEIIHSIRELGCNALWLTGILRHASRSDKPGTVQLSHPSLVKGLAGSPYAVEDFFSTDPDLHARPENPEQELKECLQRIHAAGMKAIMDFIPNHCARQYRSSGANIPALRNPGAEDDRSLEFHPQNYFYYLPGQALQLPDALKLPDCEPYEEFPARATGNDCFYAQPGPGDWYETVKLNYGWDYRNGEKHFLPEPPVWEYMRQVLLFWAEAGFDGFRCDMAAMVPVEFWRRVIPEIKRAFPGIFFIAEIYEPERYREFLDAGFDYLYDKEGMYNCLRELLEGRGDCRNLSGIWQQQEGIQQRMLRFLENHDEQRIPSRHFAGNPFHALPGFVAAAFSGKAALLLYAGQELGEKAEIAEGFSGNDGRSSIFDYGCVPAIRQWLSGNISEYQNLPKDSIRLRKSYSEILGLCQNNPAILHGDFYDLQYANPDSASYKASKIWSFLRSSEQDKLLIICSFSGISERITLQIPTHALEFSKISEYQNIKLLSYFSEIWSPEIFESAALQILPSVGLKIDLILPPWSSLIYQFTKESTRLHAGNS